MKILVTAATHKELQGLIQWSETDKWQDGTLVFEKGQAEIHIVITGVGMVATTYNLMKALRHDTYDVAINFGLCGAYPGTGINTGDVVNITEETFADLGATDNDRFLTVFDLGLVDKDRFPFTRGKLVNPHDLETMEYYVNHDNVRAITVNNVSGEERQISQRQQMFSPQVESMEGAAFFYVMLREGMRFFQVRAVSNIVEPRNREKWQIPQAIDRLNGTAIEILKFIACSNLMG